MCGEIIHHAVQDLLTSDIRDKTLILSIISAIIHVFNVYTISFLMCNSFLMVKIGLQLTEYWYSKMWTLFYGAPCTIPSPYNKGAC